MQCFLSISQSGAVVIAIVFFIVSLSWLFICAKKCVGGADCCVWLLVYSLPYMYAAFRGAWAQDAQNIGIGANCASFLFVTAIGFLTVLSLGSARNAARFIVLIASCQAIFAVFRYVLGHELFISGELPRASGSLGAPYFLYPSLLLALPLAYVLVIDEKKNILKIIFTAGCIILSCALVLTWYRAVPFAIILGILVMNVRLRRPRFEFIAILAVSILLIFLNQTMRGRGNAGLTASSQSAIGHAHAFKDGWSLFVKHPLFGVGIGNISFPVKFHYYTNEFTGYLNHPGCLPLYWMNRYGIFGLFLYLSFILILIRVIRSSDKILCVGYVGAFVLILSMGLTNTTFSIETPEYLPVNAMMSCAFSALALVPRIYTKDVSLKRHSD
jgi:O-antigen ligase